MLHASAAFAPGTQRAPVQQSLGIAHGAPAGAHGGAGIFLQRLGPTIGGSCTHFVPAQQSPSAPQISPSAPHAACWQRVVPFASGPHVPEQQSAFIAHVSHSARQPWRSAHVSTPSPLSKQTRPQQSVSITHDSPAGRQPAPTD